MTASLFDTNILVYANNADSPFHAQCKEIVEKAINGEIEAVVSIQNTPRAQNIFDLFLVATMIENGIFGIYTVNTDHFKTFESLKVLSPLSSSL